MNKMLSSVLLACVIGAVACGSSDAPPASGGGAGQAGSAGGTNAGASGAGSSGASGGGTTAGAGGASAGAGAGGSTSTAPMGSVVLCNGDGCPYGRCDNNSATTCSGVYPGPLTAGSMLCKADGEYCLTTGAAFNFQIWAVRCVAGVAKAESCATSCGFNLIAHTSKCS